jgi:hypothetical protein
MQGILLHAPAEIDGALIAEFRASNLSFRLQLWHHGTLLALSGRSSEQSVLDDHQIGQGKQSM